MRIEDVMHDNETGPIHATYYTRDLDWRIGEEQEAATPEMAVDFESLPDFQRVLVRRDWAMVDGTLTAVRSTVVRILPLP